MREILKGIVEEDLANIFVGFGTVVRTGAEPRLDRDLDWIIGKGKDSGNMQRHMRRASYGMWVNGEKGCREELDRGAGDGEWMIAVCLGLGCDFLIDG